MTMVCKRHATKRAAVKRGDEPEIFRLDGRHEKRKERGRLKTLCKVKRKRAGDVIDLELQ